MPWYVYQHNVIYDKIMEGCLWLFCSFRFFLQHAIDQCLKQIKESYDVLVLETENKGIMEKRLERIMNESFV